MGRGAGQAHAALRAKLPMLVEDRPLGPDIEAAAALLAQGAVPTADLLAR